MPFTSLRPPPPLPFSLLFLALVFSISVAGSSASYDSLMTLCSSSATCGHLNVTYPFYLSDGGPNTTFCGYAGMGLICRESVPLLNIGDNNYKVTYINTSTYTLSLVDADVNVSGECPRVHHNLTIDPNSILKYDADEYLFFFFNCTGSQVPVDNRIDCLQSNATGKQSYVFRSDLFQQEEYRYLFSVCSEVVMAPVLQHDLTAGNDTSSLNSEFGVVLLEGFQLQWSPATGKCGKCESTGGRCVYNQTTSTSSVFTCFCEDGVTEKYHCVPENETPSSTSRRKIIIGVATAVGLLLLLLLGVIMFRIHKKKKMLQHPPPSKSLFQDTAYENSKRDHEMSNMHFQTHVFTYSELQEATNFFDASREIGDGGFGTVYKGNLKDGRTVAVKRLYENNYKRVEQFMNEIEILSCLHHPNLVSLYGCTSRHSRELLLVYEFVSNGTVADHLHGYRASEEIVTWPVRLNIAIETADALAYLHAVTPPIIHRDVKTNNILLDNNFHVKVADFGLSRLFPTDVTHVSTAPQGTPGYVDPEYHQCYQLTGKSDVYSFGVVLIELISSKPAVDITRHRSDINLANMAITRIHNGEIDQLVDPSLGYESNQIVRKMITMVAELAFRCLQTNGDMRPPIKEVLEALRAIESVSYKMEKDGEDDASNDDGLLRNIVPFSPDTVIEKWVSRSTTPNTSE